MVGADFFLDFAMRSLSEAARLVTSKTFGRKFIALGRILAHWPEIVGAEMAAKAQPVKIHHRVPKDKALREAKPADVTLEIAVDSAYATLLHYQKDVMLERMNALFGERWITAIRFVPNIANLPQKPPKKPLPPLNAAQKNSLSQSLSCIEDTELKERLSRLGEAVYSENTSKT